MGQWRCPVYRRSIDLYTPSFCHLNVGSVAPAYLFNHGQLMVIIAIS